MPESAIPNPLPDPESLGLSIEWSDQQDRHPIDAQRPIEAVRRIVHEAGYRRGSISLVVVDDPLMHTLNRRHLEHDYPTDVLSFLLDSDGDQIEGEVVVSADTAAREAEDYGWQTQDEVLLYFVHGTLHLIGMDDHEDEDRRAMREAEARHLAHYGLVPPWDDDESDDESAADPNSDAVEPGR